MDDAFHHIARQEGNAPPGTSLDVREMLARGAHAAGGRVLLRDPNGSRTGAQLLETIPRIAGQLARLNGGRGQVVLIDAAPANATIEAYWAALHAGLVPLLLPRDRPVESIAPALSRLSIRGAFAAAADRVPALRGLGASAGLVDCGDAPVGGLPEGWSPLSEAGAPLAACKAFSDRQLCALALHRTADGTLALSARSQRAVALTGLLGQFVLAPGEGEVVVIGLPGGALIEWVLHCAVMAHAPVTLAGFESLAVPDPRTPWQLAVASSRASDPGMPHGFSNTGTGALRKVLVHDVTFADPHDCDDGANAELEVCVRDSGGFLFTRHRQRTPPGWFAVPLVDLAAAPGACGPAATLADALGWPLQSPQQGVPIHDPGSLDSEAALKNPAPADIGTLLRSAAAQQPGAPAIIQDGVVMTFGAFADRAARLSTVLRQRYEVKRGDRVTFLALNRPEFFETYLATAQLGAVFAPLNFRLSAPEIREVLNDCTPRLLIAEADLVERFGPVPDWLPKGVELLTLAQRGHRPCAYNTQLEAAEPLGAFVRGDDEDPSSILYTTGTTGVPKGAVRSHKSVLWFGLVFGPLSLRQDPDATHLATPPLFHIAGHETAPLPALALGRKLVIQRRFNAENVLHDVEQYRVTSTFSPPTVAVEIAEVLRKRSVDLSSLRDWSSGSAPMSIEARDAICIAAPGLRFRNSLGMTEAGGIAALQGESLFGKPATCVGQVAAGVGVRIAGADGSTLAPLATGEIQLRSPQLLTCYWNRADETKAAFDGGWFHTGDLGLFDADGDLHIVGRLKDMIITGGENVYAAEVERVLQAVPGVAEAAVIGVPDAKWGESVVAWIVPEAGAQLTQEMVVERCRNQIAHYKCPRHCYFAASLPRNAIGKVQKQKLREQWHEFAPVPG